METMNSNNDRTRQIIRDNFARIRLISVAGSILSDERQTRRLLRLLENRREWGIELPLLSLAVHSQEEEDAANAFAEGAGRELARYIIVRQKGHNESVGRAIEVFRKEFDSQADPFTVKRQSLFLTRRGGKGTSKFVSPFDKGQGTTCGTWTRPVLRKTDGSIIKGFMKASVAVGFCPVECPYCYLNMTYTEGMDIALNWDDLAAELKQKWTGYVYPINFGETSGLVEYDEWFARPNGEGSLIQFVIDACAEARVTPFFLTKIRYPRYLRFNGKVQTGISLMPEPVRRWVAPHGSPADELLESLSWAVSSGARDPVIRMTVIWQQRELYSEFLERCRDLLGRTGWRLTLDILRFTPATAKTIAKRYPDAARLFAEEIEPSGSQDLGLLARQATASETHVKKIRPSADRQAEIFIWFRRELDRLGCQDVMLTPCKGDPEELTPLARLKVIRAMPCACYGLDSARGRAAEQSASQS
jgi:DNA repair photolyase